MKQFHCQQLEHAAVSTGHSAGPMIGPDGDKQKPPIIVRRPRRFVPMEVAENRSGLSRSTLYEYIKQGLFPKPYQVGPRAVRFLEDEIEAWIDEKIGK